MSNIVADAGMGGSFSDDQLVAELTPGMRDLLHELAAQHYYRRLWRTFYGISMLLMFMSLSGGSLLVLPRLTWNIGSVAGLAIAAYIAIGFALIWPERWERQLLAKELDHRRKHGKWRWER